jgi:hypothetical protein
LIRLIYQLFAKQRGATHFVAVAQIRLDLRIEQDETNMVYTETRSYFNKTFIVALLACFEFFQLSFDTRRVCLHENASNTAVQKRVLT